MKLPPFSNASSSNHFGRSGPPLSVSPNSVSSPIKKQTLEHVQEETDYDVPLSQEVKSPAYPQGPVCIYDPYVYLYLEPSHIEAREFDVILNVAREVQNPFTRRKEEEAENQTADKAVQVSMPTADKGTQTSISLEDRGLQISMDVESTDLAGRDKVSKPPTAASEHSVRSAPETRFDDSSSTAPSTPKASKPEPEYIHIPWDHNTNVVDDLLRLCELIDDRVRQRKRILIHCQCGVSRSASLVVAYGIYQNPRLTVQEAYDAVKNRSRWIGPNMNLIYQLSEFKSKLAKSAMTGAHAWRSWRSLESDGMNSLYTKAAEIPSGIQPSSSLKPLQKFSRGPLEVGRLSTSAPMKLYNPPGSAQLPTTSMVGDITPGPSSAPLNYPWSSVAASQGPHEAREDSNGIKAGDVIHAPGAMDIDTDNALTPTAAHQEVIQDAIQEKEEAPAGAIASDLREVAKDLDHSGLATTTRPLSRDMDVDDDNENLATPFHRPAVGSPNLKLATKPSISDLPIGFSSLLTRRQGLQHLPIRQLAQTSASPQIVASEFKPIMHDDVPPTPSLLSPRAAEFTASPFHRTTAGDLAGSSVFEQGMMSPKAVEEDPRSPHQLGEAPITRSIFDMI